MATLEPPSPDASADGTVAAPTIEIDWSVGSAAVTETDAEAHDTERQAIVDDVTSAVLRTVEQCEAQVEQAATQARGSRVRESLASFGGRLAAPAAPMFGGSTLAPAGGVRVGDDRHDALKRLIGSLERP